MPRAKRHPRPKRAKAEMPPPEPTGDLATGSSVSVDIDTLARPRFSRDLIPVFMMIESDVFHRLNEKAAARRMGYDMLLRTILRDHLATYLGGDTREKQPQRPPARRKR